MVENSQVEVATGTIGTRAVNRNYPVEEGITAGTTKQKTESPSLVPNENLVPKRDYGR